MKYFSEKDGFVNAECEHCKRILKIKREQAIPTPTGFSLNPPGGVQCLCGSVHHSIAGTTQNILVSSGEDCEQPTKKTNHLSERIRSVTSFIIVVIGGGSLVALVLFIIGYTIFAPPRIPSSQEIAAKQYNSDSIDARTWAKIYVKNSLKVPSTAKFQDEYDFSYQKAKDKKGNELKDVWEVSGYVDAQNAFGVMLRNRWYVKLVKQGDKWVPVKIVIGE